MDTRYFVSYSRLDIAIVKNVVSHIEFLLGHNVWIDYTGIEAASDFRELIVKAIDNCDKVIFMLSSNSMESKFAKQEIIYAKNTSKDVIPICIDNTQLYGWFLFEFGQIDYITYAVKDEREKFYRNLFRWDGKRVDLNKIEKVLDLNFANINDLRTVFQDPAGRDLREIGDDHYYGRNGYSIDYKKAFMFYQQAADLGDVRSINYLGNYYYNGLCGIIDYKKAFDYYKIASDLGYAPAQNNLANCYYEGRGTEVDFEKAFNLYKSASEQNHVQAITSLAECYYNARGVETDKNKAFKLFLDASNKGNLEATCFVGEFYYKGEIVEKDVYKAFELFSIAANKGNAQAQYNLGYCYKMGIGVVTNKFESLRWLNKSASQGFQEAIIELKSFKRTHN